MKMPLAKPYLDDDEIKEVTEVLKSGILSLGEKTKQFEENFAKLVGSKYAVAVSSGTAGLHLCMRAIGIREGDEVITSPLSFIASANCAIFERAKPVFVDIDEKTLNLDSNKIEEKITERTKAILPVHIFGVPCDIEKIMEIAKRHNLPVIEDACESIGAKANGKSVGTFGRAGVFAFYPNKQITTGEGGMIVTDDEWVYNLCKSLSNQGRSLNWEKMEHSFVGYNYRISELHSAVGLAQLRKFGEITRKRNEVAEKYRMALEGISGVRLPVYSNDRSWFVYVIRFDSKEIRDKMMEELKIAGIPTRPYLPSIHLQPAYKELFGYNGGEFPICEKVSNTTLAIPFYTQMSDEEIAEVSNKIRDILKRIG